MGADPNAEALRALLAGPLPAREISARVGWAPRSAGPKLHSMETQKLVRSRVVVDDDAKEMVVWALTEMGSATIALPKQLVAADAEEQPEEDEQPDSDQEPEQDQRDGQQRDQHQDQQDDHHDDRAGADDEGPWPTLRGREGGVDPNLSPSASLSG